MGGHMLRPELTAGVSGVSRAHSLWVEDVNLDEVAGCQLLKSGPVPSPLCFARFHQSPSLISSGDSDCNVLDIKLKIYPVLDESRIVQQAG